MTKAMQELLENFSEPVLRKCLARAIQGDSHALRLCIERLLPLRRDAPIRTRLPSIKKAQDVASAQQSILNSVAQGRMTPSEGELLSNIVEKRRRAIETVELEGRVEELEKRNAAERER